MAERPEVNTDEDGEDAEAPPPKRRWKRLLLILPVLLVPAGGAGGALWMGWVELPGASEADAREQVAFLDLPELVVNLNTAGDRPQYLKLRISLELGDPGMVESIEPYMPRILDAFQVYLREMRVTDLEGSAGLYRLKEELQRRINTAIHPGQIDGVLFREILVQ